MFCYHSSDNDHSAFATFAKFVMVLATIISLTYQVLGLLSMTRTKIGAKIRRHVMNTAVDYMEESVDVVSDRLPMIYNKIKTASEKIDV